MTEIWKTVPGWEGHYEVSDSGRVRSLPRKNALGRHIRGKLLKLEPDSKGYLRARLCRDRLRKEVYVHKLVASVFIGPCPKGYMTIHGPNGKRDNSVGNISYGTAKQNQQDRFRDKTDNRENCKYAKLDMAVVPEILRLCSSGDHQADVAKLFGVSQSTISRVVRRVRRYK